MKITIPTAQNVELEFEIAGVGYRFLAALIDLLIMIGYVLAWGLLSLFGIDLSFGLASLLIGVPILFYHPICEIFMDGQSFGKQAMKLKVVKLDGSQPTLSSIILRWLLWIVEANPFLALSGLGSIGLISVISTEYGQRVGDLAAGTTVVRMNPQEEIQHSVLLNSASNADYHPNWPELVTRLNDRDIDIIRKGLQAVNGGADPTILSQMTVKVASLLGIEQHTIRSSEHFLRTIIDDYSYVTSR